MSKLLIGSYSDGRPEGIRLVTMDGDTGALRLEVELPGAADASFLAIDPAGHRLYATDEMAARVGAFDLRTDPLALDALGYLPAGASSPCYLALSPDGRRHLAVANYGAGVVTVFTLDASGTLAGAPQVLVGAKPTDTGHAHWVQWSPEGDRLYAVDLGHDEVRFWPWSHGRAGSPVTAYTLPAGSGPRHLAFHPNGRWAYLFTEYSNEIVALRRIADGTLAEIEIRSSLPADFSGQSFGAHIQIAGNGRTVYVSNRGHNSITAFRIGDDGGLAWLQNLSCGGDWPRMFLLLADRLLVANQRSNDLVAFEVAADGTLVDSGQRLSVPKPVMILPV